MLRRRKPTPKRARVKRPKLDSPSKLEAELWRAFSLWIRLRDGRRCVQAADGKCAGPLQAGHVISRRYRSTRYDERNVFAQCSYHNRAHSMNPEKYVLWYVERFGAEAFATLLVRSQRLAKRPTRAEYAALIARYGAPSYAPGTALAQAST